MWLNPKTIGKILIAGTLVISVSACQTTGQKQGVGAVLGAVGGGLLGSTIGGGSGKLAATAAGVVLGGLLGSETGRSLDRADAVYARQYRGSASQVPVAPPAGYAYRGAPAYSSAIPSAASHVRVPHRSTVLPFRSSASSPANCKPLVGEPGTRLVYACQAAGGAWFIAR